MSTCRLMQAGNNVFTRSVPIYFSQFKGKKERKTPTFSFLPWEGKVGVAAKKKVKKFQAVSVTN